ncbi:putative peptidylprolyl isomerase [Helianthus annuus]|nr:putative peptidylprolyl isomerase [Helianthus annuus]
MLSYGASTSTLRVPHTVTFCYNHPHLPTTTTHNTVVTRRTLSLLATATAFSVPILFCNSSVRSSEAAAATPRFSELPESGGVKVLDLRVGDGDYPVNADQVSMLVHSLFQFVH